MEATSGKAGRGTPIAVFGSSETRPEDRLYEQARELGQRLATAGFPVVTGGYGGVMEAASRGAAEAGGLATGIVSKVFGGRAPNRFLTEIVETPDLHARMRALIDAARGYVVLHGKSGTLAELALLWALHRAGCLERRPVILLGDSWRTLMRHLVHAGMIESEQFDVTRVVDSPAEALEVLADFVA